MAKFLQINLHWTEAAQDLLYQTAEEQEASILLVSEQYRNPDNGGWHSDTAAMRLYTYCLGPTRR